MMKAMVHMHCLQKRPTEGINKDTIVELQLWLAFWEIMNLLLPMLEILSVYCHLKVY